MTTRFVFKNGHWKKVKLLSLWGGRDYVWGSGSGWGSGWGSSFGTGSGHSNGRGDSNGDGFGGQQ